MFIERDCRGCNYLKNGECLLGFEIEPITFNGCYGDEIYTYSAPKECHYFDDRVGDNR